MKSELQHKPFHFQVAENVFDDQQLKDIWEELDSFQVNDQFVDPRTSGGAVDNNGNLLKQNRALFLKDKKESKIRQYTNEKILNPSIVNHHSSWFFNGTNWNDESVMVSYYDHGDYYAPHNDTSMLTACIWLFREPQEFDGGIFSFPTYGMKFKPVHNYAIIFPSNIVHSVSKVIIKDKEKRNKGLGRYTITQFASVNLGL